MMTQFGFDKFIRLYTSGRRQESRCIQTCTVCIQRRLFVTSLLKFWSVTSTSALDMVLRPCMYYKRCVCACL